MRPSDAKARQRERIAKQVREYLAGGGEIKQLPPWASGVEVELSKRLRKMLGRRIVWGEKDDREG